MENSKKVEKRPWTGKQLPKQRKFDKSELVFGMQPVLEALRSDKDVDKILLLRESTHTEVELLAREKGVQIQRVPIEKISRITTKNHQGVIAFISAVNYAQMANILSETFEKGENPLLLVLDRITDVRNFGAIARTAECSGVQAIVVPSHGSAPVNPDAMKTSSGALNYMPVCREAYLGTAIDYLLQSGVQVVVCSEKTESKIYDVDFTLPTAIVMGSEEDGISDSIIRRANHVVAIPMQGQVGSLNVSVATGVILYEAVRQRALAEG